MRSHALSERSLSNSLARDGELVVLLARALLLKQLFLLKLLQLAVVLLVLFTLDCLLPVRLLRLDGLLLQVHGIKINAALRLQLLVSFVERFL